MTGPDRRDASLAWPWMSLACTAAAAVIFQNSALSSAFEFSRDAIDRGQLWRLWTSSFVHFSGTHLLWNAVVVVVAGSWAERRRPGLVRTYYLIAPAVITCALLVTAPHLERFRGLSGLAAGLVATVALLTFSDGKRWQSTAIALLLGTKIIAEALSARPILADIDINIISLPGAHLAGIACASIWYITNTYLYNPPQVKILGASRALDESGCSRGR